MSDTQSLSMVPSTRAAGQATMIESQRAIAEVQGAIIVAQNCPRDGIAAKEVMLDSCGQSYLAERAFFRFPKGSVKNPNTGRWEPNIVSGPSIHLARELARIWGNIQYGVKELRRDDIAGESEMMAFAWDVQTNTRTETVFIVKHLRDKKTGPEKLTDLRDIYENNANAGARRVRECIFAVLPPWFTEQAKEKCVQTNETGGGTPLVDRISQALERFAGLRVTQNQLERKLGKKAARWTGQDVAVLIPVYRSITQGETTVDAEFPPEHVEPAQLAQLSVDGAPPIPVTNVKFHAVAPPAALPDDPPETDDQDDPGQSRTVPGDEPGPPDPEDTEWPAVVEPGTAERKTS